LRGRRGYRRWMDLSVVFLGTGGSVPTARRATACVLARVGRARLLFDCGEGAQRQMHRSIGLVQLDDIYITHYHADHYLGVPGLLKTYDLQGRERPLRIVGPPGLASLFKALSRILGRISYEVDLLELEEGEAVRHEGFEVRCFAVEHQVRAYGYGLVEDARPGRFDAEAATRLGVEPGPDVGRLQGGEPVQGSDGLVRPDQVMGEPRRGRKLVITGDTAPCGMTRVAAHEAELLVHDGSFADAELERAA
jgi:ribonuclease Z